MQSGEAYQGVLKAVSSKLSVALALAHNKDHEASRENTERLMQLEFADIVSVSVMPEANSSLSSKGETFNIPCFLWAESVGGATLRCNCVLCGM